MQLCTCARYAPLPREVAASRERRASAGAMLSARMDSSSSYETNNEKRLDRTQRVNSVSTNTVGRAPGRRENRCRARYNRSRKCFRLGVPATLPSADEDSASQSERRTCSGRATLGYAKHICYALVCVRLARATTVLLPSPPPSAVRTVTIARGGGVLLATSRTAHTLHRLPRLANA